MNCRTEPAWQLSAAQAHDFVPRHRPRYAVRAILVIGVGLLARSAWLGLPTGVAKYAGDALWALLLFLLWGIILPRLKTWRLAALALTIAWVVEFSQLYHAPWLDAVRRTGLGALALGAAFNCPDLLAYTAGILLGALPEHLTKRVIAGSGRFR